MTQSSLQTGFKQANYYGSGDNGVVTRLVIHDEEYPVSNHSAEDIANFFEHATTGSAHYVVDADSIWGCVLETQVAYHAPPNLGSIGTEHDGYSRFTSRDWLLPGSQATLHRSARLHADLSKRHDIPVRLLTISEVAANQKGLCGHDRVSAAFHQSDHTDPGVSFPWAQFFNLVNLARQDNPVQPPKVPLNTPTKPSPIKPIPTKAPEFPLSDGEYFGPKTGPSASISGYFGHHSADDLVLWQTRMHVRGFDIACDGYYGAGTQHVAEQFQSNQHLKVDGLIGPITWEKAWTTPVG